MSRILLLFVFYVTSAVCQEDKMNFHVSFETGINNGFNLNQVLLDNNLKEVKQNVIGLNLGYIFCPKKIGYFSDLNYQRTLDGSIYHSFGFSAGILYKQKIFNSSSINYITYFKLRSHNVNVINSEGNDVLPDQISTVSGGDLFFYNNTIGFGGKIILILNDFWNVGISFDSSVSEINWKLKNQHISNLPIDSFSNFTFSIGINLKNKK